MILKHIETAHADNFALLDVVGNNSGSGSAGIGDQGSAAPASGGGNEVDDNNGGPTNVTNRKVSEKICYQNVVTIDTTWSRVGETHLCDLMVKTFYLPNPGPLRLLHPPILERRG